MKRAKTLSLLINLAQDEHLSRQRQSAQAQQLLSQAIGTEKMLQDYRVEQFIDKAPQTGASTSTQHLLVRQKFSEKLDLAITQQAAQVQARESIASTAQSNANAAAIRLRSIERLVALRREKQEKKLAKADQTLTDERASQMSHRKRTF